MEKSLLFCVYHGAASVALRMTQIRVLTELVWHFTRGVIRAVTVSNLGMNKTLPASAGLAAQRRSVSVFRRRTKASTWKLAEHRPVRAVQSRSQIRP